jgi:hypothetical protein
MKAESLNRRLIALEEKHAQWSPEWCDPKRRLAKYAAWSEGKPWDCTGTAEKRAQREARLAGYMAYFEGMR